MRQRIRRAVPRELRPYLGALRRKVVFNPLRVYLQRRKLLKSADLTAGQVELLRRVSPKIHYRDNMYAGNGENYFRTGLSAVGCIDDVLHHAGCLRIRDVLDMPCGYGRELRFMVLRFPEATFTACDIQPGAVDFCVQEFGAVAAYSRPKLSEVSFDRGFDLIWCGSLVTHLNRDAILDLLRLFSRHMNPGGVLIFTFHGDYVLRKMLDEGDKYELTSESQAALIASYTQTGYAYQDYPRGLGYFDFHPEGRGFGVSLTSPDWLRDQTRAVGGLQEVYFKERGWANHQDVLAVSKRD